MAFNMTSIFKPMVKAAKDVIGDNWPEVKDFAESQFRNLAQTAVMISNLQIKGKITKKQAKFLWIMQKNTTQTVMLAIEGMGIIIVERAINAALKVVKDTINKTLGWKLIS